MPTAIVTGASRGLGAALAQGLAEAGWSLVLDARDGVALAQAAWAVKAVAAPGVEVVAVSGDVTDPDHRAHLVAAARQVGSLELVVNNAGTLGPSPLPALVVYPLEGFRAALEANVVAPLALVQAAGPVLETATRPRVVNITSDAAVEAYPGWGGYGASKAAVEQLGAVLAAEQPGWRVWTVDPGDMRTRMHQDAFPGEDISDRPDPETVVPALLELIGSERPSGRVRLSDIEVGVGDGVAAAAGSGR
jgi:NAD(P)-dependent dehydrogenase (short-subunit alcohol dehydrogenase family)